ncbi:nitrile hydratase subunit beta [Parageobacillus toebii]|uniref:nitrile hydratase subunit beta n=1 Tax=Parageobacillus toebii TaxID=153151 RepID=UPI002E1CAD42|nr:nitrile hydratase subunit beta [Parageobacillus toebii]MED4971056.1 nitrile hydratase subunit beta [Parageobacillus toebii]
MNGVHDLGGKRDFGPIVREDQEPLFYEEWERRVFAMMLTAAGKGVYNLDEFRHAIERMDPVHYLSSTYYEHWLASIETLFLEKNIINEEQYRKRIEEIKNGMSVPTSENPELKETILRVIHNGVSSERKESTVSPRFRPGDRVRVKHFYTTKHTRCPQYVMGKVGTVELYLGIHVFPDSSAHGGGEAPQPLYNVRFEASELWDDEAHEKDSVYVDLWDSYLDYA